MLTERQLMARLDAILVPGVMRSLSQMNLLRGVKLEAGKVEVSLASAALGDTTQDYLRQTIVRDVEAMPEAKGVSVTFEDVAPSQLNRIDHVVAVMSGKGGVGKSMVTALLAVGLRRAGLEVGILDADITGPSTPHLFGITTRPLGGESGILPVSSPSGIEIMSINLLLPNEEDAVIWRGPLIAKAIQQFWDDVLWGRLDYLLVDLPPGTGDAPLTVMQSLPLSGVVIVFTPQRLVAMVVRKAADMAERVGTPILGLVENLSYLVLPDGATRLDVFGESIAEEMALSLAAPLLAQLPIDPRLSQLGDAGQVERYDSPTVASLAANLARAIAARRQA